MAESKISGVQCCVCKKIRIIINGKEEWVEMMAPEGMISHTYCPVCYADFLKDFEKEG